jgi:16S rRNA (adenine1518-N6/adenine1519-N6)-dimethyltransferase
VQAVLDEAETFGAHPYRRPHPVDPPDLTCRARSAGWGSTFLSDPRILQRIADALEPTVADTVLEIGPGPGGLTTALALGRDGWSPSKRTPIWCPAPGAVPDVTVVEGDALELDWHTLGGPGALVAGNIPYNITSPLIDKALAPPRPPRIVFLVQKEVATA